jgi:hypothetical protein
MAAKACKVFHPPRMSPPEAHKRLGHILHYVEGMIMEIRDKEKGERE